MKKEGGLGIVGVVQIIFIIMKLVGVINWSWFVVLLPLIITGSLTLFALLVSLIVFLIKTR